MREFFAAFAKQTAQVVGAYWAFLAALALVAGWAVTGPLFHYSDTWQLVINTATTIITFLMVFLIQNTQNRDARAMQLKLNELIAAVKEAHNDMIDIESLSDAQIERIARRFDDAKRAECDAPAAEMGGPGVGPNLAPSARGRRPSP